MLEYYVFKSLDIPTQIVGRKYGCMHASKYAELMHIRLSLCLSLVSYLCLLPYCDFTIPLPLSFAYCIILAGAKNTVFVWQLWARFAPGKSLYSIYFILSISLRLLFACIYCQLHADKLPAGPTDYQLFPPFIIYANNCVLTLASCTQLCIGLQECNYAFYAISIFSYCYISYTSVLILLLGPYKRVINSVQTSIIAHFYIVILSP